MTKDNKWSYGIVYTGHIAAAFVLTIQKDIFDPHIRSRYDRPLEVDMTGQ